MKYGNRSNGNPHGKVYTKESVVNFMIDNILLEFATLSDKVIIDPAVGSGAFIIPIIKKIQEECNNNVASINKALKNIYLFDIDEIAIEELKENIQNVTIDSKSINCINIITEDYLLYDIPKADIIIGNPPYVRFDNIPEVQREKYNILYFTFSGRADIYIPFIEKSLKNLKKDGILTFICADRWFNNSYGKKLRSLINHNYNLKSIYKINGFNPFEEDVIAYPSIFLIKNDSQKQGFIYSEIESDKELVNQNTAKANILYFDTNSEIQYDDYSKYMYSIEEQKFQIGIGVATGADKIFIIDNPELIEKEILLPIITRKDISNSEIFWKGKYLINTYANKRKGLVDLDAFPKLKKYLETNKSILSSRHVAKKNEFNWYKLIDPVKKDLLNKPKLLIPDISTKNEIIFEKGQYYPHHNFYYITSDSEIDLLVLRSLLNTDFVKKQVARKGLLMNGGALRWQAQTLRKIYLPLIDGFSDEMKKNLIQLYDMNEDNELNRIINKFIKVESLSATAAQANKVNDADLFNRNLMSGT